MNNIHLKMIWKTNNKAEKNVQNFWQIAEIFRGTMVDVKSGLRNESDLSKK